MDKLGNTIPNDTNNNSINMQWSTTVEVIDIETGEIITKKHVEKGNYVIIKKEQTTEIKNNIYGKRKIKWLCEKNRQQNLF